MAKFLSRQWFDELEGDERAPLGRRVAPELVIEIEVMGAPEGEVRYQVVLEGEQIRAVAPGRASWPAQVKLSSDYPTMAGIASGRLSPLEALSLGRARVSGDMSLLSAHSGRLAGLDLLPPALRATTTF